MGLWSRVLGSGLKSAAGRVAGSTSLGVPTSARQGPHHHPSTSWCHAGHPPYLCSRAARASGRFAGRRGRRYTARHDQHRLNQPLHTLTSLASCVGDGVDDRSSTGLRPGHHQGAWRWLPVVQLRGFADRECLVSCGGSGVGAGTGTADARRWCCGLDRRGRLGALTCCAHLHKQVSDATEDGCPRPQSLRAR